MFASAPPAKPVLPPPPGAHPAAAARTRSAHRRAAPVPGCHWVAPGGRRQEQNWSGPACAALCPLIRCFRQGGCGDSSPAHSCGARRGRTSWAVSPLTPAGAHGLPFCWPRSPLWGDAEGPGSPGQLSSQGPAPQLLVLSKSPLSSLALPLTACCWPHAGQRARSSPTPGLRSGLLSKVSR